MDIYMYIQYASFCNSSVSVYNLIPNIVISPSPGAKVELDIKATHIQPYTHTVCLVCAHVALPKILHNFQTKQDTSVKLNTQTSIS